MVTRPNPTIIDPLIQDEDTPNTGVVLIAEAFVKMMLN